MVFVSGKPLSLVFFFYLIFFSPKPGQTVNQENVLNLVTVNNQKECKLLKRFSTKVFHFCLNVLEFFSLFYKLNRFAEITTIIEWTVWILWFGNPACFVGYTIILWNQIPNKKFTNIGSFSQMYMNLQTKSFWYKINGISLCTLSKSATYHFSHLSFANVRELQFYNNMIKSVIFYLHKYFSNCYRLQCQCFFLSIGTACPWEPLFLIFYKLV